MTTTEKNENKQSDDPLGSGAVETCGKVDDEPPSRLNQTKKFRLKYFPKVSDQDWNDWHWQFKNRVTSVAEIARFFHLSAEEYRDMDSVSAVFPLSATPYYLSLIDFDNVNDPVKLQLMPDTAELCFDAYCCSDPLGEEHSSVVPGLVHRYPDRVVMVLTDICPVLCRHCTRKREWKNGGWVHTQAEIDAMLAYIRQNPVIRDVIISGGDPLTLSTSRLESVLSALRSIPHVEIIRIGTRYPVVLPQRIDDELCNMLSKYGTIWLNTHYNHPNEITEESRRACDRLVRAGVPVNNQSVLLKGINDSVAIQKSLCHKLLMSKVRPYYLFQCDNVQGTEHFHTTIETGVGIIEGLRGYTSGLAVPNYVIDLPGGGGKITVQPDYVLDKQADEYIIRNYKGDIIRFKNPVGHKVLGNNVNTVNVKTAAKINGEANANRAVIRS
ncbi:KamA family radical SAM protein [Dehalococcoides mccartyi]|uniref:Lysine 2,3-aminomutase n=1 Tax=Dehalococcoides mccartyi (strain VS) TaxID=311424 RepID=D2BHB8_DEHMV|nr:KamA family radical SAM protein [Dehalococcoides mccartyi]ACZ61718.1 lysine 2,3-aminomutase [Dehalococcoides mccartyi VS]